MFHSKQVNTKNTKPRNKIKKYLNIEHIVLSALIYLHNNIRKNCIIKHNNISPKTIVVAIKADGLVITSGKILNYPKYSR